MKLQKTRKKFYGKWIYKVSFVLEGASVLRMFPLKEIGDILENTDVYKYTYVQNARKNKKEINYLVNFLKNIDSQTWAKRIERSILDIYTNDQEIFQKLQDTPLKIRSISDPGNNIDILDKNIILAKKYPHNEFRYRVYLLPHKMKDISEKITYIQWIDQQSDIKISDTVKRWFLATSWNWDRRYILVKNQHNLLMLKMRCPEAVGKIYEYQLSDK